MTFVDKVFDDIWIRVLSFVGDPSVQLIDARSRNIFEMVCQCLVEESYKPSSFFSAMTRKTELHQSNVALVRAIYERYKGAPALIQTPLDFLSAARQKEKDLILFSREFPCRPPLIDSYRKEVSDEMSSYQTEDVIRECMRRNHDHIQNVLVVEISNSCITMLPPEICLFTELRMLYMSDSLSLKSLPEEIGSLLKLERVYLIGCVALERIPSGIGHLRKLRYLSFQGCISLTQLPTEMGDLKRLEVLNVKGCKQLRSLPEEIMSLPKLEKIKVKDSGIPCPLEWPISRLEREDTEMIEPPRPREVFAPVVEYNGSKCCTVS